MNKKEEVAISKRKVALPGRIIDLLWSDDEFYREVVSSKKITLDKFPKTDQWVDEMGFHMEFALAGYSTKDISIKIHNSTLLVESRRDRGDDMIPSEDGVRSAKPKITYGSIVRGIARRNFKSKVIISSDFSIEDAAASMLNGLLHIIIPKGVEQECTIVRIKEV